MEDSEFPRQVLEQVDFGVIISDLDSNLLYLNGTARHLLGVGAQIEAGQLTATQFRSQAAGQLLWNTLMPELVKGGRQRWTTVLRRLDGADVPVEQTIFPLWGPEGQQWICAVIRDIQADLAREAELARALHQCEAASLAKSDFLASMSHELRTPMNAILGFSQVLRQKSFGELNAKQERYLDNILSSGNHLLRLINEVLDLSRVESGHLDLALESVDVQAVAAECLDLMRQLAEQKGLEVAYASESEVPPAYCDRGRLRQAVLNLLGNAVKFTPQGGRIELQLGLEQDVVRLCVRDSGIGIEPQDLERIFGAFERVGNTYSRQQEGSGLGLALTRRILRAQGGDVTATSQPGQGSEFVLRLPVYRGQTASELPLPQSGNYVQNSQRLRTLQQTGLLDSLPEEAYDRFVRLAADLIGVPIAKVSLVDSHRQFFKSAVGLKEPLASLRETSLDYSFCQHVVNQRGALTIEDARHHQLVKDSPAIAENNVIAYLGVPLSVSGEVIGALCVIDSRPRQWTSEQLRILEDLAAALNTELALRWQTLRARAGEARWNLLIKSAPFKFWTLSRSPGACPDCLDEQPWQPSPEWLESALVARRRYVELGQTYQWDRLDGERWILERGQPLNREEFVGCWVDLSLLLGRAAQVTG
ncbi:MAG: ATP-binding protein [Vulcanimicrobiota bacterium]